MSQMGAGRWIVVHGSAMPDTCLARDTVDTSLTAMPGLGKGCSRAKRRSCHRAVEPSIAQAVTAGDPRRAGPLRSRVRPAQNPRQAIRGQGLTTPTPMGSIDGNVIILWF